MRYFSLLAALALLGLSCQSLGLSPDTLAGSYAGTLTFLDGRDTIYFTADPNNEPIRHHEMIYDTLVSDEALELSEKSGDQWELSGIPEQNQALIFSYSGNEWTEVFRDSDATTYLELLNLRITESDSLYAEYYFRRCPSGCYNNLYPLEQRVSFAGKK